MISLSRKRPFKDLTSCGQIGRGGVGVWKGVTASYLNLRRPSSIHSRETMPKIIIHLYNNLPLKASLCLFNHSSGPRVIHHFLRNGKATMKTILPKEGL